MRARGPAVYFDGTSSARNDVVVEAGADRACASWPAAASIAVLDEWAYAELRRMSAPDGVLRLGRRGETLLARLEIRDAELAAAIEDRADTLDRGGAAERRLRRKVVGLSFAAAASLIVTAVFGVPALGRAGSFRSSRLPSSTSSATRSTSKSAPRSTRGISARLSPAAPRRRNGRTRGARQARRQARSGRRAAVAAARRGRAPRRAQCLGAARRPHLCRRRADRQGADARRTRRRAGARDRPRRAPRRHPHRVADRRPVVPVRHDARRFRRRRRRRHRRQDRAEVVLFAPRRGGGRRL